MFTWGFLVLVYPNLILTAVDIVPQPSEQISAHNQIKQIWEELDRENKQLLRNDAVLGPLSRGGEDWGFHLEGGEYSFSMRVKTNHQYYSISTKPDSTLEKLKRNLSHTYHTCKIITAPTIERLSIPSTARGLFGNQHWTLSTSNPQISVECC